MVELVDTLALGASAMSVRVRISLWAPTSIFNARFYLNPRLNLEERLLIPPPSLFLGA